MTWKDGANKRRAEQLGMPYGTASNRLRKQIMFKYVVLVGDNFCYKCGAEIETVDELSVEHKLPWENRNSDLFWDLDNIAFSHRECNTPNKRNTWHRAIDEYGNYRCSGCKEFLPKTDFATAPSSNHGINSRCKKCVREAKRERSRPLGGRASSKVS